MPLLFESHAHYDDDSYDSDREELFRTLPETVGIVINAGASVEGSFRGAELAEKYPYVFSAAGVHPHDVKDLNESDIEKLSELCKREKTVAVGEIGLDYYFTDYFSTPKDVQKYWFAEQISLSLRENLPLIVHSRDADKDTFDIIADSGANRGVIHCFSGSAEMAAEYVKLGFYIGIGGVITYKNAKRLVEVVREIPLGSLLIETDCPYLSPEPLRGTRNDSRNLKYIAAKIAEIKGVSEEEVINATFLNGVQLFGLRKPK